MPVTRSASRAVHANSPQNISAGQKRKLNIQGALGVKKRSRIAKSSLEGGTKLTDASSTFEPTPTATPNDAELVPATLTFSFEEAKRHLISVDHRFEDLFDRMSCRPFQHLESVHPFRALVTSILGQQISWLAARSINHKFRRLYDSSLPEKPTDDHKSPISSFPTPEQVAKTDLVTLKSAGLSTRKAEYIQDLAARFADGRLSTQKLVDANDDELTKMLTEVRGIGNWTVDMFAIFSLRRPDILPVGDLGVQRGLLRWFLSLHSPVHGYSISPHKVAGSSNPTPKGKLNHTSSLENKDVLPTFEESSPREPLQRPPIPDLSSVPPLEKDDPSDEIPTMPAVFTPSVEKTLNKLSLDSGSPPIPLPEGLSVALLKSRLGKGKVKGAFLTPKEMGALTASWRPYRSIGVYYMWSLAAVAETST